MYERLLLDLRNVMADLYSDVAHARRLAEEARLPLVYIDFEGSSIDVWGQVVKEAERRGALRVLIDIATGEYPSGSYHDELVRIRQGLAWYRRRVEPSVIPLWGDGGDDPPKPLGERIASVEAKVSLILVAIGGLYLGMFWLGYLVITRGS